MEAAQKGGQDPRGQDSGSKPLSAEPDGGPSPQQNLGSCTQDAPRKETPCSSVMSGDRKPVEAPREAAKADAGRACQPFCLGGGHKERNIVPPRPPPLGEDWPLSVREAKPVKRPPLPAPGKQKKSMSGELVSESIPGVPDSTQGAPNLPPCKSGESSCHLSHLLHNLGQNNQNAEQRKRPPEMACPVKKKTRTLYRSDQLEELERIFQEDHYPDGDKRREISQAVGVTPQRIMVWFQNRRAKWRKVEKLNGKESQDSPPAGPAPAPTHSQQQQQHSSATEFPPTLPLDPEPGPFPPEPSLDVPPEPPTLLMSDQTVAPAQQSENAQRVPVTPLLFSPPPVQRSNLPLSLGPGHKPQPMPLLLEPLGGGGSHKEAPCGPWGPSLTPPPTCSYLEESEPCDYQHSSYLGPFQFPSTLQNQGFQPPQPQFPFLPPFPSFHMPSSLTPPLLDELFPLPHGSSGATSQGYFQGSPSGQMLLQPPTGNPGAVPWNDPFLPELPFLSPFCPSTLGQPPGGDSYFPDLFPVPCAPDVSRHPSPGHPQLPEGTWPLPNKALEDQQLPGTSKEQSLAPKEDQEKDKHGHAS